MKKILFNDDLTEAVLKGWKNQTRRIVKDSHLRKILHIPKYADRNFEELIEGCTCNDAALYGVELFAPFAKGEEVAIAQRYKDIWGEDYLPAHIENEMLLLIHEGSKGISNKMFVRAELMPHHIEITGVRIERLQDISEEDCLKEGIRGRISDLSGTCVYSNGNGSTFSSAKLAFASLIDKTCGKGTWNKNPFVFVYDFKLKN